MPVVEAKIHHTDFLGKIFIYMTDFESKFASISPSEIERYVEAFSNWHFGKWDSIAEMATPEDDIGLIKNDLLAMKACAHIQLGDFTSAKLIIEDLDVSKQLVNLLLSSTYNTLGRSYALLDQREEAKRRFFKAVEIAYPGMARAPIQQGRTLEQSSQLGIFGRWEDSESLKVTGDRKKLFIDCGGYDGCSAIKFKLMNPSFDIISFEANSELWDYYELLPSKLVKQAVFHYDGEVEFRLDPVDADGSSLIKEKEIDFRKKVKNEDCPVVRVGCVDLSGFVREQSKVYDVIYVKLDVEGAEYLILEKMMADRTLGLVERLYAEFHWSKIGLPKERHNQIVKNVKKYTNLSDEEWDAQEFAVHKRDINAIKRRLILSRLLGG